MNMDMIQDFQAENSNGRNFNFVAAGDWGCKNEAKNTFAMMKKRNLNCIQRQVIIRMNPL